MFSKAVIRSVICLAMAAFAPGIAQAASTIYDCKFATGTARDGNWIPTVLVLRHDTATGKVVVFDPIIKHFIGNPIDARLSEETSQRRTFTWVVDARNTPSERQSARMAYWLNYYVNGRPARMIAKPSGYDNEWTGDGTCVARQG